jgi:quercetin dioxygenase-like cupin family protein
VKPGDRRQPLSAVGVQIEVLVSEDASKSQRITHQTGGEGVGPPPHSHSWDESFYVLKGQVLFTCAGETTACSAGTLVYVPGGTVHAFAFGPGGAEMLEMTGSGSQAIQMFRAMDRELVPGPIDVPKTVEVCGRFGLTFHL